MTITPEPPDNPETPDPSGPDRPGTGAPDASGVSAEQAVLDEAMDVLDDVVEGELAPEDLAAMDRLDVPRRLLLVHAHPDDETIATGATMAFYADAGAHVTLVTCTRGERGEVIPAELAHLEGTEGIAEHRAEELATAMVALGVGDHRFLGSDARDADGRPAPVVFRDSGMVWTAPGVAGPAPDVDASAFALTGVDEAAVHLVRVIREVRPQVVVTYEPGGGYGHPDHVHAHRVTTRAVELARAPGHGDGVPWDVAKVYWSVVPASQWTASSDPAPDDVPPPSVVVPDDEVTTEVDATSFREAKAAALRAHSTQVVVDGGELVLSNGARQPIRGVEHYRIAHGHASPPADGGREQDLFAGLA